MPPGIRHGGETLEGSAILDEVEGGEGLLLWQLLRDVTLWSTAGDVAARDALFSSEAAGGRRRALAELSADSALLRILSPLAALLENPGGAAVRPVGVAANAISRWAEENDLAATALYYAQAAALADKESPAAALRVAMLARTRGALAHAESWYRRTIGLARQAEDWDAYAEAYLGMGALYAERDRAGSAEELYRRSLRAARRHSLHPLEERARAALRALSGEMSAHAAAAEGVVQAEPAASRLLPEAG